MRRQSRTMNILVFQVSLMIGVLTKLKAVDLHLNGPECGTPGVPKLVINGSAASPGQYPWMVKIAIFFPDHNSGGCSGSIITRRHVLTAAHCLMNEEGEKASAVEVFYGHTDIFQAKTVDAQKILVHPRYTYLPIRTNDIGIILVKKPFQYTSSVRPLCLPLTKMHVINRHVIVAGWGRPKQGAPAATELQYTTLKTVPHEVCQKVHGWRYKRMRMLCAQNSKSTVCHGDSGGPMFIEVKKHRYVQVGITSYGSGNKTYCRNPAVVFTRVDAFMPWIKRNIGKHKKYDVLTVPDYMTGEDPPEASYMYLFEDSPNIQYLSV